MAHGPPSSFTVNVPTWLLETVACFGPTAVCATDTVFVRARTVLSSDALKANLSVKLRQVVFGNVITSGVSLYTGEIAMYGNTWEPICVIPSLGPHESNWLDAPGAPHSCANDTGMYCSGNEENPVTDAEGWGRDSLGLGALVLVRERLGLDVGPPDDPPPRTNATITPPITAVMRPPIIVTDQGSDGSRFTRRPAVQTAARFREATGMVSTSTR